jgi:hypothetical protein
MRIVAQAKDIHFVSWFLAIFGGMTVVHLGGQTDLLGAGTFWLVNVAARWFLRQDATSPQSGQKFLANPGFRM